ncbi:MAG: rane protein [Moraxellaceae bacterium]|jgi:hypothetical protein|nr:rane protein [Moraxellaceae bacterium]
MAIAASILLTGIGATLVMDLWSFIRGRWLGIPRPDYGLVGRWVGHMPQGRFRHAAIKAAAPVRGERVLGWGVHYLTGVAFAGLLVAGWGVDWLRAPTLAPALAVGIGTIAAPFLLMQPGMGAGLAARRTPNPAAARRQSLVTHAVFGFGLYAAGWLARALLPF